MIEVHVWRIKIDLYKSIQKFKSWWNFVHQQYSSNHNYAYLLLCLIQNSNYIYKYVPLFLLKLVSTYKRWCHEILSLFFQNNIGNWKQSTSIDIYHNLQFTPPFNWLDFLLDAIHTNAGQALRDTIINFFLLRCGGMFR